MITLELDLIKGLAPAKEKKIITRPRSRIMDGGSSFIIGPPVQLFDLPTSPPDQPALEEL